MQKDLARRGKLHYNTSMTNEIKANWKAQAQKAREAKARATTPEGRAFNKANAPKPTASTIPVDASTIAFFKHFPA